MLSGARVNLRTVTKDDLDWLLAELNKPQARGEWSSFALRPPADLERQLLDPSGPEATDLAIEDKRAKRIGLASFSLLDPLARCAALEISIFEPADRGKGFGLEAHRLLIDYLFRHRGFHRVEVASAADNVPEQRLLEKLGFRKEGVLRKSRWAGGNWHDLCLFALLEEEWQSLHWDQLGF